MQEDIENRTVNLVISTSRLSARVLIQALQAYLRHVKAKSGYREQKVVYGKQTVKQLLAQNRGVSSVEISKTGIRGFERVARKFGIDYAVRKEVKGINKRYLVFFKAQDTDALQYALKEYMAKSLQNDKPSIKKALETLSLGRKPVEKSRELVR